MNNPPDRALENNAVADLWRLTLDQIPTIFGRLSYLASLRNLNTGKYEHFGLAQRFNGHEADRAIRLSHLQVFREWIGLDLRQKKPDLDQYVNGLEGGQRAAVEAWASLSPVGSFLPDTASDAEVELFLSDFNALLGLLKNVNGVAGRRRNASPRR